MSNDDEVDHSGGKDDEQQGSRGDGSAAADRSSATNQQQLSSGSGDNRIALLSRQMQQQQQQHQQQHQYTPLQYSTRPDFSSAVRDASASFLNPSPYHHHQHFSPFGRGGGGGAFGTGEMGGQGIAYGGASSLATVGSDERNAAASMGLLRGGNSGGGGMTHTVAGESEEMMMMQQQQQFHQYSMSQQPSGMKKSSGRESGEDPSSVLQYGSSMPHQYQIKSVLKEFPFVYDGHSGWVCRHCSHLPHTYRGLNYAWQGGEGETTQQPPPNSFVDQHLRFCPALNQPWAFSRESMTAAQGGGGQIPMQQPRGGLEGAEGEGGTAAPEGEKEKRPSRKRKPDPPTGRSPMANMTPAEAAAMFPVYSPHPYQMSMSTYGTPQMMKQPQRRKSSKSASPKGRQTTDANYEKALVLLKKRADEMPRPSSSDDDIGATLVQEEDNDLLTDYFYYMMYQLVVCRFTEKDRKTRGGKRQNVVVGYGGLQCAHCASTTDKSRKFFWSNVDRLANSFAEIPAHVLKCKMCPEDVLEALLALKGRHAAQMTLLPRGSQKVFLRRMWRRLHDKDSAAAAEAADTPAKRGIEVVGSALKSPEVASGTAAEILKRATAASSPEAEHHQQQRVLIALPQDKDWLSDMDCFIRKQVEVFSANSVDVKDAKEDGKFAIQYGQVGLRCVHCAKVTMRARGDAVTYPHAISCIYESVRELQRLHFSDDNVYCPNLPQELKSAQNRITTFASSLSSVLRRYYVQAAKALGLFDTEGGGIRAGGTVIPLLAAGFSGSVVAGKRRSSLVKEEDDNEEKEDGGEQQRPAKRVKQSDDDDDDDIPKSPRPPAA